MKIAKSAFFAMAILALLLSGCASKPPITPADDSAATAENVNSLVAGNSRFAFDLYSRLGSRDAADNVFFSPYSISTAMAVAYEGARGTTADEMGAALRLPQEPGVRQPSFARIYNTLNKSGVQYELYTANALWTQKSYQFLEDYKGSAKKFYGADATNLDFANEAEKSTQAINSWVAGNTNGKIRGIIPSGYLNGLTRLVITNAIYFKGKWLTQFTKADTMEEDFIAGPQKTVKVQMMSIQGEKANFSYGETDALQIIELPYQGKELSMLIMLPKEGHDIASAEKGLSAREFSGLKSQMAQTRIAVQVPKFKFAAKYFMGDDLKQMGMRSAFTPGDADFSGMDGKKSLYISSVIHQATVEVDEEGTEAAAATAVGGRAIAPDQPKLFRADHPFVFLIQDNRTGSILFMGRVMDPTK